jgi:hypothetical protein
VLGKEVQYIIQKPYEVFSVTCVEGDGGISLDNPSIIGSKQEEEGAIIETSLGLDVMAGGSRDGLRSSLENSSTTIPSPQRSYL